MSLDGYVYRITDAKAFFTPIILGEGPPSDGKSYEPWPGLNVLASYFARFFFVIWDAENILRLTAEDGSFSIPDPDPFLLSQLFGSSEQLYASIYVSARGSPRYRSGIFQLSEGEGRLLNIYLYPDTLNVSDGITAGEVSTTLASAGLPGNTTITASPSGLSFQGSHGQVSLKFGVSLQPDTSLNLSDFIDLSLTSWNINVDWPTSWFESADDVLASIRSGLQGAATNVNSAVLEKMEGIVEAQEGLPPALAQEFFTSKVSVTFMDVYYPNHFTWGIGDKTNPTPAIVADPCIGYPRDFAMEPVKVKLPWWWISPRPSRRRATARACRPRIATPSSS